MFEVAADEVKRLWVTMVGGANVSDADYNGVVQLHKRLALVSPASGEPSIFIMVIHPESVRPEPIWRQRFAEAEKLGHGKRVAFCIVTDSAVMRGIRVAVNWLAPPPKGYEATSASTIDEAIVWAEKLRPGIQADLRRLHREIATRARESRSSATSR